MQVFLSWNCKERLDIGLLRHYHTKVEKIREEKCQKSFWLKIHGHRKTNHADYYFRTATYIVSNVSNCCIPNDLVTFNQLAEEGLKQFGQLGVNLEKPVFGCSS